MKNANITFLVQGPVRERTKDALKSIRHFFPGSIIVLSTWKGENISGLDYDKLVLSDDPGPLYIYQKGEIVGQENTNRQILSVVNAIPHVETLYCVKTRTDIEFTNNCFLNLYSDSVEKYPRDKEVSRLKQRVLISSINTPNPNCFLRYVCQISDWFFFGLTEDIKKIWCQKLIPQSEYYHNEDEVPDKAYKNGFLFGRFSSEQIITIGFLRKYSTNLPKYFRDKEFVNYSNRILASEFICAEPIRIGFTFLKYRNYCELKVFDIKAVKSYFAFYSVTTNYVRWNQICTQWLKKENPSIKYILHDRFCQFVAMYIKKRIYKL